MRIANIVPAIALLSSLLAAPARAQQEAAPDSAAPAADVPHERPSLDGYRKVAILSRDMLPGTPGYETSVEVYRDAERGQVLRFVTGGVTWALVVRPPGAENAYTLRDFDCSGGFAEDLEAGTPLAVPDCAVPARPGAAATN